MTGPSKKAPPHDTERTLIRFRDLGLMADIQLGRYNYSRSRAPLHPHVHENDIEICFLEKGRQVYETGGKVYNLKGGDIFLTLPGEAHSTAEKPEEKGRMYWLIVPLPKFQRSEKTSPLLSIPWKTARKLINDLLHLPRRHFHASRTLALRFGSLMELAEQQDDYAVLRVENELRNLLLDLITDASEMSNEPLHPGINRVIRRIRENPAHTWSNADLAAVAGLSESHFKATFKKVTGNPPADYLARRRVETAKEMLERTDESITGIAFECGFSSSQYFATVFKRYARVTPSEYRIETAK